MLKISFGLFPLARYFCKRLQKMYGLGEPARYLNMLYPHFQKESCSFDVGQAVMSSRRTCDKRHISFLTSIYREGTTKTVCSFAPQICDKSLSTVFRENSTCAGGCCDALPASELGLGRVKTIRWTRRNLGEIAIRGHFSGLAALSVWTASEAGAAAFSGGSARGITPSLPPLAAGCP